MNIRRAQLSDHQEIMKLYTLFIEDDRFSKPQSDSFATVINNPRNFIFVVEDADKLVGFASFSVRDVVRYPKPIAELDELFVSEAYRKKGAGKLLMEAVEKQARELECYRLFIESRYDKKVAHQFYEKLGYTNYGVHFIKNL